MKNLKISVLLVLTIFTGCSGSRESEQKKLQQGLYDEVMVIHDEIMPKMSKMLTLEKELEKLSLDSTTMNNPDQIRLIESRIAGLKEADETMMQWMRSFEVNQEGWPHDSIMSYLSREKEKINRVRDQSLKAIADAESLLQQEN